MTTPAGWYDDGSGRQRWWDGQQWTENFAPETGTPESAATEAGTAESAADVAATDVAAGEPAAADVAAADQAAVESQTSAYPTYPVADSAQPAAGYPGAAPAYPGAGAPAGYPATSSYAQQPVPEGPKKLSILGLVGLGLSVLGTILVFIPVVGFVGFILLAAGFVVSIVSLFLKGKKWPGIAGLSLAVVGTIIGIIMAFVYLFAIAQGVSSEIDNLPSSSPSIEATEPSDTDGTDGADEGVRPTTAEVAVGLTAILTADGAENYTEGQITCLSGLLVDSDLDNSTLRAIAESDGTLTDVDAAYGFAEVLGDTEAITACFAG